MIYREVFQEKPALSALFLRANAGAGGGVWIAPSIPAAKLAAALALVPEAKHEPVLALVDVDQTSASKPAMLVTVKAAYLLDPSTRVPIESIVQIPSFPAGTSAPGVLDTSLGSVTLGSQTPAARYALYLVLRAIALFNRGGFRGTYSATPIPGPIGELAKTFLEHEDIRLAPLLADRVLHSSSSIFGSWLEHEQGESLIAYVDAGGFGSYFIALTDRRMIFRTAEVQGKIPYAQLENVDHDRGFRSQKLTLHTAQGLHNIETTLSAEVVSRITNFLLQLCLLPIDRRCASPITVTASQNDPAGVQQALQTFAHPELRATSLLMLIESAVAQKTIPVAAAQDLVVRVIRLQNTLRSGHGSGNGFYRTALSAADLMTLAGFALGPPIERYMTGPNQWRLGFYLHHAPSTQSSELKSSAFLGIAMLAVAGVGWIETGAPTATLFHLWIDDLPGGAAFSLSCGSAGPLGLLSPQFAGQLLDLLSQNAPTYLLRRILFGWNISTQEMLQIPIENIEYRARTIMPTLDLAPFVT